MPTNDPASERPPFAGLVYVGPGKGGAIYRQRSAHENGQVPDVPLFRLRESGSRIVGGRVRHRGETFKLDCVSQYDRTYIVAANDAGRAVLEQSDDRPRRLASGWP